MKVKNKKVIQRLSFRTISAKGKKNLVAIFAIMLTTILFTTVFTIGGAIIRNFQEATMRQVGGSSMAGIKYILPEDYEKLAADPKVEQSFYRIIAGILENEELSKLPTEVSFAQDLAAKNSFSYPEEGRMPQESNEIATSTLVLDALGIPHELGEIITLNITVDDKHITKDFVLSGYWEGDPVAMAQQCWISRSYCDEIAPTPENSFYETMGNKYAGYWMMDFDFSNSWNIADKTISLLERNGYNSNVIGYGINWAYATSEADGETVVFILFLLGLILASGYLIIFNIFSLNVAGEIKSYGLLKTIGTTEKQLKNMVRRQAFFLSMIGIPLGLILGIVVGKYLFPVVLNAFVLENYNGFSVSPLVITGAILFSFFTVRVSCNKACRLAAKVSPIEAVRYVEVSANVQKKEKKSRKITPFSFAWANIGRNPKKVMIVVVSLSLSMILMNSVYGLIKGMDMDKFVSFSIIGDNIVTDSTILNPASNQYITNSITEDIRKEIENLEGVEEVHHVYSADADIILDEVSAKRFLEFTVENSQYFEDPYAEEELAPLKENKIPFISVYGVDLWGTEQLEYFKGVIDWEKFQTGNYCLINTWGSARGLENKLEGMYCDIGENLILEFPDGTRKEYEVMAFADMPYAMTERGFGYLGTQVILPAQECMKYIEGEGALMSILMAAKGNEDSLDKALNDYTEQMHPNLTYVSRKTYEEEFKDYVNMFWLVGGGLSFVLALIGILNFLNAMVTEIIARRQELAMMESVGMTGKQMKSMLAWEGMLYAFFAIGCSIVLGSLTNSVLLKSFMDGAWYYTNHFTILPILLCSPVFLLISYLIPMVVYRNMVRKSVVERLREAE
ncbi:MAG: ABC transporter permease [Lachnospiraceae bacterium]|nr:ABC transporter permease [Lachnospiraceae bacterium]